MNDIVKELNMKIKSLNENRNTEYNEPKTEYFATYRQAYVFNIFLTESGLSTADGQVG